MWYLSRAVSCSNMYRERDPQCSSADDMVSRPTSAETMPRSASVKRLPVAGGASSLAALLALAAGCEWPLATPFAAKRGLSGASARIRRVCTQAMLMGPFSKHQRRPTAQEHASVYTALHLPFRPGGISKIGALKE